MPRLAAVLLVALVPGFVAAQAPGAPRILDVKVEKDRMVWTEYVTVPVQKTVTVTVTVNGKAVLQDRTVTVYETTARTVANELKTVKATDGAGKEIAADKLAELLKDPTPVVVSVGPISDKHRALFKEKVLVLELPAPMPPK
jgi:hypothetical protein